MKDILLSPQKVPLISSQSPPYYNSGNRYCNFIHHKLVLLVVEFHEDGHIQYIIFCN